MRSITNWGIILGLLFLILAGCGKEISGDEKNAEQYVEQQGYKVITRKGEVQKYVLDKSKFFEGSVESTYNQQIWGVQKEEPDKYFGKEITEYGFTVKNHPLEKKYNTETNVSVMVCDGKVIGGTSFPVQGKVLLMGAPFSLDGKTLEEVTGLTYKEWSEKWGKKYGR
ncbi:MULTISPECIES: DUF4830 domain-containing protein [unclassified Paenibacillus]|uniref:DUF4830 domain-containing protein n=1 Tax=unclassified Paenibacillus TaxID=185978 RepID=UPI001FB774D6|nr:MULTISPECIES: DUF4830 domain-containing protein [unclassified Paenibacillus]NIK70492.1 hypothetical protein [Paenibacillus sp. BK720]